MKEYEAIKKKMDELGSLIEDLWDYDRIDIEYGIKKVEEAAGELERLLEEEQYESR